MALRILIIQKEIKAAGPLVRFFKNQGDEVWTAWDLGQAQGVIDQVKPHLIFLDIHFPGDQWLKLLSAARRKTETKVVITSSHPDVQREIQAKSLGVRVFLRQPYRGKWIKQALDRLEEKTQVPGGTFARRSPPKVRTPMRIKITVPYLLLALLFAMAVAIVASRVVLESAQDRFLNQLIATRLQNADQMVREEDRLLNTLRLISNSTGVAEAVQSGDAETLRTITLPLVINAQEEAVEILDLQGISRLSIRNVPGMPIGSYDFTSNDPFFQSFNFVQIVLQGEVDIQGDKYADLVQAPWGNYFYVSGPIIKPDTNEIVGVILVGKSLNTLAREMKQEQLADVSFYDFEGLPLSSSIYSGSSTSRLDVADIYEVIAQQDQSSLTRNLTLSEVDYTELLGPWEVRGGRDLGLMGVTLARSFLTTASQITRLQIFVIILAAVLLVVLLGFYLANLITIPLQRLVRASSEVALGNLDVKVDSKGDDEVAVLSHSFNSMVAGLQEGSIYRDLLGRTVSPEVREQLRQTFNSGDLRLEGQEAIASVLMTDIRGFTGISEKADPARVFEWLNEYFAKLVPIIVEHGGVVNKFDGDAMLAFFGILPRKTSPKRSALSACESALEMVAAINQLNELRAARGEPTMVTGVGVHTGVVIAGGLGSRDRLHYTIIGDTVNSTQRIESLTRDLMEETGAIISQATLEALGNYKDRFSLNDLGEHSIRGKAETIRVYRLLSASLPDPNAPESSEPLD